MNPRVAYALIAGAVLLVLIICGTLAIIAIKMPPPAPIYPSVTPSG